MENIHTDDRVQIPRCGEIGLTSDEIATFDLPIWLCDDWKQV